MEVPLCAAGRGLALCVESRFEMKTHTKLKTQTQTARRACNRCPARCDVCACVPISQHSRLCGRCVGTHADTPTGLRPRCMPCHATQHHATHTHRSPTDVHTRASCLTPHALLPTPHRRPRPRPPPAPPWLRRTRAGCGPARRAAATRATAGFRAAARALQRRRSEAAARSAAGGHPNAASTPRPSCRTARRRQFRPTQEQEQEVCQATMTMTMA